MAKVGRPTVYKASYCEEVIELLAKGHSITAFAGSVGVDRSTVFRWMDEKPEFKDSVKVGQALAVKFWEGIITKIAAEGGGNATAAIFGLKNRAADDWSDKVVNEHTGKDGGPMQVTGIRIHLVDPKPRADGDK